VLTHRCACRRKKSQRYHQSQTKAPESLLARSAAWTPACPKRLADLSRVAQHLVGLVDLFELPFGAVFVDSGWYGGPGDDKPFQVVEPTSRGTASTSCSLSAPHSGKYTPEQGDGKLCLNVRCRHSAGTCYAALVLVTYSTAATLCFAKSPSTTSSGGVPDGRLDLRRRRCVPGPPGCCHTRRRRLLKARVRSCVLRSLASSCPLLDSLRAYLALDILLTLAAPCRPDPPVFSANKPLSAFCGLDIFLALAV